MKTLAALVSALLTTAGCVVVFIGLAGPDEMTPRNLLALGGGSFVIALVISLIIQFRR